MGCVQSKTQISKCLLLDRVHLAMYSVDFANEWTTISLTNGLPSSLPSLLTIIGAEAVHMGIVEAKRRKSDKECNSRPVMVWSRENSKWEEKQWKDVLVVKFSFSNVGRRHHQSL